MGILNPGTKWFYAVLEKPVCGFWKTEMKTFAKVFLFWLKNLKKFIFCWRYGKLFGFGQLPANDSSYRHVIDFSFHIT